MAGFKFSSIGHAFAFVAQKIVAEAKVIASVMAKIQTQEPLIEAITGMVAPQAVVIERAAFGLLGKATQAVLDVGPAVAANGLNITLDQQEIADLHDIATFLKSHPFTQSAQTAIAPAPAVPHV